MKYRQSGVIGGKGSEPHQFRRSLNGMALDRHGLLHAAGDSDIKVYDPSCKLVGKWPTQRPALAIAVAPTGHVYCGEEEQIEIFDPATKTARVWRDPAMLGRVTAIGFAGKHVLAGDARGRAIRCLDSAGKTVNTIGADNNVGGLMVPNGAVSFGVDGAGVIHAANPGRHRIERYSVDGKLLGYFGKFSFHDPACFTGCCNPTNVAVGDRLYVTEKGGPRLKAYTRDGQFLCVIAEECFDPGSKNIAVLAGPRGRVYAADPVRLQILAFEPEAA